MKHFTLLIATLLLLPAGAKAQFAWYGSEGKAKIVTGLEAEGSIEAGEWWSYSDVYDGGQSKIVWDNHAEEVTDKLVKKWGGISGTAVLDLGELYYAPMAGVGFNVAGVDPQTNRQLTADATSWKGIAIAYSCDCTAYLELGLGESLDSQLGYALPLAKLEKSSEVTFVRIPWSQFKQPEWGIKKIEIAEAVKSLASIKFQMRGSQYQTEPISYHFKITAIGSYDMPEQKASGDVNSDGSIDVADIAAVIDVMAGKSLQYKDKADVNGDNNVDVADIASIIDKMAGK